MNSQRFMPFSVEARPHYSQARFCADLAASNENCQRLPLRVGQRLMTQIVLHNGYWFSFCLTTGS
jgi:hypothetical protein